MGATTARRRVAGLLAGAALMFSAVVVARQQAGAGTNTVRATLAAQADKTVFSGRCAECHRSEAGVWAKTKHKTGFDELHTRESAKKIYAAMGLTVIKRGTEESTPACLQCHYTPTLRDGQLRATEGVTCESCHGAARDWISIHNNYGVQGVDFQEAAKRETPEHRTQRIAQARAAGMRRPSDLYGVAANCFACHTVPNEQLVNKGGHSTGSSALNFLNDSQGPLRHNFLESFKTGDGKNNAERSPERKRLMYAVGRMVDLEYSVRAAAQATSDGRYFGAIAERVNNAADNVVDILKAVPVAELRAALDAYKAVDVRVNNRAALTRAADRIRDLTQQWLTRADGAAMAAIDPLWNDDALDAPPPVATPANPASVAPMVDRAPAAAAAANPRAVTPPVVAPPTPMPVAPGIAAPAPAETRPAAAAGRQSPVTTRPAWRNPPSGAFLPDVPCTGCHEHAGQTKWWEKDPHKQSILPLRNADPKYAAIATAYGIAPSAMASSGQICVWCHGTSTTKSTTREVRAGVECQQCHGPGAAYKEPHQKGYREGLAAGLTDLKDATVRAATCAGCHYITDAGLIAAGHRSGADFDIAKAMTQIKHWGDQFGGKATDIAPAALIASHKQELARRGPVPTVAGRRAAPATVAVEPPATSSPAGAIASPPVSPATRVAAPAVAPTPGPDRASAPASATPSTSPVAAPAPGSAPAAPIEPASPTPSVQGREPAVVRSPEEQLLELKKRLEALYRRRVGRSGIPE